MKLSEYPLCEFEFEDFKIVAIVKIGISSVYTRGCFLHTEAYFYGYNFYTFKRYMGKKIGEGQC